MTNSVLSCNSASQGGGIYNNDATATVTNSTFSGNSSSQFFNANGGMAILIGDTFLTSLCIGPMPVQGDTFQIRYASNLNIADSVIDITNTGVSATALLSPGRTNGIAQNNIDGSVCLNIYAFAADEQEVACCSCLITPNALWSASVKTALLNSTLTPALPNEVVIKLIASTPNVGTNNAQSCNPASVTATGLARGLAAWGTSVHGIPTSIGPTFQMTETPFAPATLLPAELQRDVQECQFIQVLGSGQFGICKGCQNAGLGAAAQ